VIVEIPLPEIKLSCPEPPFVGILAPAVPPPPTVIVYVVPEVKIKGVSVLEFLPEVSEA
jgi:hypothetical protein